MYTKRRAYLLQKYDWEHGGVVKLSISADTSCRGLSNTNDAPFNFLLDTCDYASVSLY